MQTQHQVFLDSVRSLTSSTRSWADVDRIIQQVPKMLDCTHCTLFYKRRANSTHYYPGPTTSKFIITTRRDSFYSSDQIGGLVPHVLISGVTLCINKIQDTNEMDGIAQGLRFVGRILEERNADCRSMLIVPIVTRGEVTGVIRAYRKSKSRRSGFAKFEREMLESLSSLIAPIVLSEQVGADSDD